VKIIKNPLLGVILKIRSVQKKYLAMVELLRELNNKYTNRHSVKCLNNSLLVLMFYLIIFFKILDCHDDIINKVYYSTKNIVAEKKFNWLR